jgi:hypothetical protein
MRPHLHPQRTLVHRGVGRALFLGTVPLLILHLSQVSRYQSRHVIEMRLLLDPP